MDHELCKYALSGMGTAIMGLAWAFWKVLSWWKIAEESRLTEALALQRLIGGDDETKKLS